MEVKGKECLLIEALFRWQFRVNLQDFIQKSGLDHFVINIQYFPLPAEEGECITLWITEIIIPEEKEENPLNTNWEESKNIFFEKELIRNRITEKELFNKETLNEIVLKYDNLSIKKDKVLIAITVKTDSSLKKLEGQMGIYATRSEDNQIKEKLYRFLVEKNDELKELVKTTFEEIKFGLTLTGLEVLENLKKRLIVDSMSKPTEEEDKADGHIILFINRNKRDFS